MPTPNEFENRRNERRRRERLRKKRIRAALLLIILIGIIVLICTAVSTIHKNKIESESAANNIITAQNHNDADNAEPMNSPDITGNQADNTMQGASMSIPNASIENNLIQIIADSGQSKHCYLTFDDGPTSNITPQVLDVLRRYQVKATFFEVGSLIEANPDMARRVYEEGHLIANHSYSHNYDKLYATSDSFITEILDAENSIRNVMNGEEPFKLIRFPGGSYNAGDHAAEKQRYKTILAENGFYYCDWNTLTGDAEGKTKNASELLEYLKESMIGFNNIIVLMHDASTKQATADALGPVIEYVKSQGYTFHRLDDIDYQTLQSAATISPETGSTQSGSSQNSYDDDYTASTDKPNTSQKPSSSFNPSSSAKPNSSQKPNSSSKPSIN